MKYFLAVLLFSSISFADSSIEVIGTCQKTLIPDVHSLLIQFENRDKSAKASSEKVALEYNKFKERLPKSLKLTTNEINTYTILNEKTKENEHFSQIQLKIEGDKVSVEEALLNSQESGLSTMNYQRSVSDELSKKAERECLSEAVLDAKVKAQALLKGLDLSLGKVKKITYDQGNSNPAPLYRMSAMKSQAPEIEEGDLKLSFSVRVEFHISAN